MPDVPLAYFLTFRCHGTWLAGDARGYTSFRGKYGTPHLPPDAELEQRVGERLRSRATTLNEAQRSYIAEVLDDICSSLGWTLLAKNARTNHVHVVVVGPATPERMLNSIKSWTTRKLRAAGLADTTTKLWSRHGSTVYLWSERDVEAACAYVTHGQGMSGNGRSAP